MSESRKQLKRDSFYHWHFCKYPVGIFAKNGAGTVVDDVTDALDFHRIGGGNSDNLIPKAKELELDPPGICMLKSDSPLSAAGQMKKEYPKMMKSVDEVGSISSRGIRDAGFKIMHDPSKRFPNHHRLFHIDGASGFNEKNRAILAEYFDNIKTK